MNRQQHNSRSLDDAGPAARAWRNLAVCAGLLLAVAMIYGRTIGFDFVNYDDNLYVYDNPHLAKGFTAENAVWALTATEASNWHPLTWFSLLLDYRLFGAKPWGFHLTNVLLHAANAILLFWVLLRMTGDFWPSVLAAAIFAVHPLRVESVAWISERKDVLSGLFFMLTLAAYGRYVRHPFCPSTAEGGRATLFPSRETGVGCVLARTNTGLPQKQVRASTHPTDLELSATDATLGRQALAYGAVVIFFALGLTAKPMLVTLPFVLLLLDYWPLGRGGSSPWRLVAEKIPLFALSGASCWITCVAQDDALRPLTDYSIGSRLGNAVWSYAVYVWQTVYPAGLAVFYPHPMDGLAVGQIAGAALLLAVVTGAAVARRRQWPWFFVGWFWFVGMLVPVIGLVQVGQQARADRYAYLPQIGLAILSAWGVRRAADAKPRWAWAFGVVSALVLAAWTACAWEQTAHWRNSESLWKRVLACTSKNAVAHNNLGAHLHRKGRDDEAMNHYLSALDIAPFYAEARNNIGKIFADSGLIEDAIRNYRLALEVSPRYVNAMDNLAKALSARGRYEEAVERWAEAIRIRPDHVVILNRLAWTLATCPDDSIRDGSRALELAERARQLTDGRDVRTLDVMAAAYAELGRFDEAAATAEQAMILADGQKQTDQADAIRRRIQLYRAGSPFREVMKSESF